MHRRCPQRPPSFQIQELDQETERHQGRRGPGYQFGGCGGGSSRGQHVIHNGDAVGRAQLIGVHLEGVLAVL